MKKVNVYYDSSFELYQLDFNCGNGEIIEEIIFKNNNCEFLYDCNDSRIIKMMLVKQNDCYYVFWYSDNSEWLGFFENIETYNKYEYKFESKKIIFY